MLYSGFFFQGFFYILFLVLFQSHWICGFLKETGADTTVQKESQELMQREPLNNGGLGNNPFQLDEKKINFLYLFSQLSVPFIGTFSSYSPKATLLILTWSLQQLCEVLRAEREQWTIIPLHGSGGGGGLNLEPSPSPVALQPSIPFFCRGFTTCLMLGLLIHPHTYDIAYMNIKKLHISPPKSYLEVNSWL